MIDPDVTLLRVIVVVDATTTAVFADIPEINPST